MVEKGGGFSEDALKAMLSLSKETLKEVTEVLERGRVTRDQRSVQKMGPWCVGPLYKRSDLEVSMFVSSLTLTEPTESVRIEEAIYTDGQATYIGVKGRARITIGTFYKMLNEGKVAYVDPGRPHILEPLEVGCELIRVLVSRAP